jgi:peptidyl-prolyl cis-trans isomerase C
MLKFSKFALLSTLLSTLLFTATCAMADGTPAAEKAAALVNGVAIPQARVDLLIKYATAQGEQIDSPELRKRVRDDLITNEVLSQAAVKNGLEKQPDVAQQIEYSRQSILSNAFAQDYAKSHPIDEEVMKQDYEAFKARIGSKEYKISHILVESETEAKQVVAALKKKGANFAKIAKSKSKDPGSKDKGGELGRSGWSVPTEYVQPFAEAALKLNNGQVSAPVQTQFGWHIIKLHETRDLKLPTYEEMKPQIEKSRKQQAVMKAVAEMREKAKVE